MQLTLFNEEEFFGYLSILHLDSKIRHFEKYFYRKYINIFLGRIDNVKQLELFV